MKKIKVIRIVGSGSLIINVGLRDGVTPNWRFDICGNGEHVVDPETNEDYGFLGLVKAHIRPIHIMDKMTECINAENVFSTFAYNMVTGAALAMDLNVDPKQISGRYRDADMIIRIGDTVVRTMDYEPKLGGLCPDDGMPDNLGEDQNDESTT